MKSFILPLLLVALSFGAENKVIVENGNADVEVAGWVGGHFRGNGTYVEPYYRTEPDGYEFNNRGYQGW